MSKTLVLLLQSCENSFSLACTFSPSGYLNLVLLIIINFVMSDNIEEIVGATMRSMQANLLQQMDERIGTRLEAMQQQLTAQQKKMRDL